MDYLLDGGVVLLKCSELWQWYRKIGCLKEKLDGLAVGARETINDHIGYTFPIGEGKLIILERQVPSHKVARGVRLMDKKKQGLVVSLNCKHVRYEGMGENIGKTRWSQVVPSRCLSNCI